MSGGKTFFWFSNSSSKALRSLVASVPAFWFAVIQIARFPLWKTRERVSSAPQKTSATSPTRRIVPSFERSGRLRIVSSDLNAPPASTLVLLVRHRIRHR